MLAMNYDMRQSKDVSKGKGGKRKKYTPPFGTLLPAPSHAETHFFRDLLKFLPHQTTPSSQQTRALLLARAGTSFLQVNSCVWWPDEDVVFSYCVYIRKQFIIIEAICSHSVEHIINVHYFYLSKMKNSKYKYN
jgi:hypothetical protein